ncbi:MAG: hypothetical protein M9949_04670 [Candidatus Kapabacteria bacterium]|nr:hypothetical protein [Candidatus Kapabacteria bacterium]
MSEIMNILASIIGYIALILGIIIGVFHLIDLLGNYRSQKKYDNEKMDIILRELRRLDMYCRAEYPIVEDIVKYLESGIKSMSSDGGNIAVPIIDEFRDQLRKKYPKV